MFETLKELKNLLEPKLKKTATDQNAISMTELLNATKESAGQLAGIGIQENELTALFGTGIASTGESGETVGRAVNGIIMNLQKLKGETGFEGEILDEQSLTEAEARCNSLTGVGDGVTKLRDPLAILKELASVYNSLPEDSADSWQGLLNQLSNTWTNTIGNIADSNVIVTIINSLNKLLKIVNRLTNALGSFGSITLGAGLFAGLKNVGNPKMFGLIIV